VAVAWGPCMVNARVADGVAVEVVVETEYPFRPDIRVSVRPERVVEFPLLLRVPGWAEGASVQVGLEEPMEAEPGTFFRLMRRWQAGDTVALHLPMAIRLERRYRQSIAVKRGPLVFALKIGEEFRLLRGTPPQADWEVYPTTPWNYGLVLDGPVEELFTVCEQPIGPIPFAPEGAPVMLRARGRRVPAWRLEQNSAGPLPLSPVVSQEPEEEVVLVPYGSTNLRITEFPQVY